MIPSRPIARQHQPALQDSADSEPIAAGCPDCPYFKECGGLATTYPFLTCDELCVCADPSACSAVCRRDPSRFVQRIREVHDLRLENVPRAPHLGAADLPGYLPYIEFRPGHGLKLREKAVCLSLYEATSLLMTGRDLRALFRLHADATVVLTGVGQDRHIEKWWSRPNTSEVLDKLREARIGLITAPNFSLFTDLPRFDDLHSIKRIALTWAQIQSAGIKSALHLNGRTETDYRRWTSFVRGREEVQSLAFEFATGASNPRRGDWHATQLAKLGEAVGRPLTLLIRGGAMHLPRLSKAFSKVVYIDTNPYMKAVHRQAALRLGDSKLRWHRRPSRNGRELSALLQNNIARCREDLAASSTGKGQLELAIKLDKALRRSARGAKPSDTTHMETNALELDLGA